MTNDENKNLAVLHNRNKMVNAFATTEWVAESGGAVISRSVTFFSCVAERALGMVGQLSRNTFRVEQDNFCPEGKNLLTNVTNRAFPKLLRNRS